MTPITISPASPDPGDLVTFQVTFKAQNGAATNVRVEGGIGYETLYTNTFASLDMGEERTISFTWRATAGIQTIWFELDPDRTTGDVYPENNKIEQEFTVSGAVSGDLKFMGIIKWNPSGELLQNHPVTVEAKIKFPPGITSAKVKGGVGDGSSLSLWETIEKDRFSWKTVSFRWDVRGTGDRRLWFTISPASPAVIDTNPDNNMIERNVTIKALPDLKVTEFTLTPDRRNPNKIFFKLKFKNDGPGCVSAFHWIIKVDAHSKKVTDGRFAAHAPACALGPGEEKTHLGYFMRNDLGTWAYGVVPGNNCERGTTIYSSFLEAKIDDDKKVAESNDNNNSIFDVRIDWFHGECVTEEYANSH